MNQTRFLITRRNPNIFIIMTALMWRKLFLVTGFFWLIFFFFYSSIFSLQIDPQWAPLSRVPGYSDDTFPPFMVADQNKTVHAFVSQWVGGDNPQKAVVYRQWTDAGGWTIPIDVLLPTSGETQVYSAYIDHAGIIHLLVRGGEATDSSVYYTSAPINNAGHAAAWSRPEYVGGDSLFPGSGAIIGDDNGHLIIIYNGSPGGNGVYASHSADNGQTWSEPKPIFLTFDPELTPFSFQFIKGREGQAHAVWNVVNDKGIDLSVHYANVTIADNQWSVPVLLDEKVENDAYFGPSFPDIVDNGQELLVMYNSGNPAGEGQVDAGRPVQRVRLSNDGGETWGEAYGPFPRHLGRSGSHALVVDSENVVHALFIQRIEPGSGDTFETVGGMWHSAYENGRWSEPDLLDLGRLSGHDLRAVVSQGNVLLVTMREDPGVSEIGVWHSSAILNIDGLPVQTPESATPTPTMDLQTSFSSSLTPTPTLSPIEERPQSLSPGTESPADPIFFGLVPVVFLIGVFIVYQIFRQRQ